MKHLGKLAAGVALAFMACGAVNAKQSTLEIGLEPTGDAMDAGTGKLRYTISNHGSADLLVLAWETPLRGIEEDLFDVQKDGQPVEYIGRHYKRPAVPLASDYIELKAGETLSVDIDLSAYYDMRDAGNYAAQALAHFHDTFAVKAENGNEKLAPISERDLRSETVHLWVDGSNVPYAMEPVGVYSMTKAGGVAFVGCSNSQQSAASSGLTAAKSMATDANAYLGANKTGPRYTTWFGTYSSSNYSTVKNHFTAIGSALNNQTITFHCDCTSSAYAWVYPNQPYNVHLCNAYWNAPTSGTDSKGGTTIHEVSHFDIVANTDDLAYGQTACKKLASKGSRAIRNADSHEYFAENTPALN